MALKLKCWLSFLITFSSSFDAVFGEDVKEIRLTISNNPGLQCVSQPLEMGAGDRFRVYAKYNRNEMDNQKGRCRWQSLSMKADFKEIQLEEDLFFEEALGYSGDLNYTCVFYTKYAFCNTYNGSTCHVTNIGKDEGVLCITKVHNRNTAGTVSGSGWIISICVLLLIIVIVASLWIGISYMKKRLRKNNSSSMNYQNLPEHHGGSTATPTQWNRPEEVIYEEPNSVYNLYAEPTTKSNRNKLEPAYSEPGDTIRQHTYLNVHQMNDRPNFASGHNKEPTYASVSNEVPMCVSEQNNEQSCTSVQYNEPTYAPVEPNYTNPSLTEFKNLNTFKIEVAPIKETSYVDTSKYSNSPFGRDPESCNQNREGQNSNDNAYTKIYHENNEVAFNTTKMPVYIEVNPQKTYVNLLKDFRDKNHGYVNGDVTNDLEPAYCEIDNNINEINSS